MKFVDRKEELKLLDTEFSRKEASFVVIYGRRRVGKSALIREFCRDKRTLFFLATEENEQQNRMAFQRDLAAFSGNELLSEASFSGWEPLFSVLAGCAEKKDRLVLVMDEFQYLGKSNPAFPSVFMKIWEEKLKNTNIMVILCGSLVGMMYEQTLSYDSPLYGRRTAQLLLRQIPFEYMKDFTPGLSEDERILRYAVTGGVPKYIETFGDADDIYEGIEKYILNTGSFLYYEPEFLLEKEVSEIGSYFSLLRVIAQGARRISEIAARMETKQTGLTKYIKTLIDLDLLERVVPVTEDNPEKSKMGQYRIKDNFIKFWFRFVYPYRGMIEAGLLDSVRDNIKEHFIENHVSYVYEEICRRKVLFGIKGLPRVERAGAWWDHKNAEIDIVGFSGNKKEMIFGECKYSRKKKGAEVYYELKGKTGYVKRGMPDRRESFVIFSRSGFTEELKELSKKHGDLVLVG